MLLSSFIDRKSDRNSAQGRDYSRFSLYSSVVNKKYAARIAVFMHFIEVITDR